MNLDDKEPQKGCVLVIDDELPNRLYIKKIIEKLDYRVLLAADGPSGIALAEEHLPDLVLVDVVMPKMSGYVVCAIMQKHKQLQQIPIIMVTAKTSIEDLEKGFKLGVVDYIRKPFNPRELRARVKMTLDLKMANDRMLHWQKQMTEQLKLAGVIQRSMMDLDPIFFKNMIVRKANEPSLNVGGDMFDVISLGGGRLCVYMADVCGHGVGPAMIAFLLKAMMTDLMASHPNAPPHKICNMLNERFGSYVTDSAIYATFFIALYEPLTNCWTCLSCGHPPPVYLTPFGESKTSLFMKGGGMPIGLAQLFGEAYTKDDEVIITTEPGSFLFLYTDGLIETLHDETDEECGMAGLTAAIRKVIVEDHSSDWANDVLMNLAENGYELGTDDCSAIAIKLLPQNSLILETKCPVEKKAIIALSKEVEAQVLDNFWPQETAHAIQLLILEHGMNVVQHGRVDARNSISVCAWIDGDLFRFWMQDSGRSWKHETFFSRADVPEGAPEHGRGLLIIKRIASSIDIYRRHNKNAYVFTVAKQFKIDSIKK